MGIYFNPDNNSFTKATKGKIYVDKTGLLNELNRLLCTEGNCVAISHARRFGKSQAVGMIDTYRCIVGGRLSQRGFGTVSY